MAIIVGNGEYRYRIIEDWAKLPEGWSFKEVGAVGVDAKDNVYVFNRGDHPMMVFDRYGKFLRSWGEGQYPRAHGVHMGPDDSIYLTDDGGHFVRKCRARRQGADGARRAGQTRALYERRAVPPLHPHRAVAERRDLCLGRLRQCPRPQIFARRQIADVVGRARHRSGPVQHRPQHLHRCRWLGLCRRPREPPGPGVRRQRQIRGAVEQSAPAVRSLHDYTRHPVCYIGELGPVQRSTATAPISGPRVSIVDHKGNLLSRFGDPHAGTAPTAFLGPHGLAVDSRGDLYVGEVSWTQWPQFFPETPRPIIFAHCRNTNGYVSRRR